MRKRTKTTVTFRVNLKTKRFFEALEHGTRGTFLERLIEKELEERAPTAWTTKTRITKSRAA